MNYLRATHPNNKRRT